MRVLAVVLIVLDVTTVSLGCSCYPTHLQYKFCRSDFVVHILPIQELISGPIQKTYRVFVIEVFKDVSGEVQQWSINNLVTPSDSAACGIYLELFKQYIVGGSFEAGGQFKVRLCNIYGLLTSFTECELALMHGTFGHDYYRKGYDCSCQVISCEENCHPPNPNECVWNPFSHSNDTNSCQRYYGGKQACSWLGC